MAIHFPQITTEYNTKFQDYSVAERFAASLAVEPPKSLGGQKKTSKLHAALHYVPKTAASVAMAAGSIFTEIGITYTLSQKLYANFYKSRRVTHLYSEKDIKSFGKGNFEKGAKKLKRLHQIESAKMAILLVGAVVFSPIAKVIFLSCRILEQGAELIEAVKNRDLKKVAEKTVSIAIKVFTISVVFAPNPVSIIVMLSLNILEGGYQLQKTLREKQPAADKIGPSMPTLGYLATKIYRIVDVSLATARAA